MDPVPAAPATPRLPTEATEATQAREPTQPTQPTAPRGLASRQLLVLQLLAKGYPPTQIAGLLTVNTAAVLTVLSDAAAALGVTESWQAVDAALARGLIL